MRDGGLPALSMEDPGHSTSQILHRQQPSPRARTRRPPVDGTEVTLHAAISGSWVVLARDRHEATRHAEAAAARLGTDLVGTLMPVRTKLRDVLLIRPDGHVAWRGRAAPEKLSAWLNQALGPA